MCVAGEDLEVVGATKLLLRTFSTGSSEDRVVARVLQAGEVGSKATRDKEMTRVLIFSADQTGAVFASARWGQASSLILRVTSSPTATWWRKPTGFASS